MRLEDDIAEAGAPRFMIAAEAPIIIAKACEIFVLEVRERGTAMRKWIRGVTCESKTKRNLSKNLPVKEPGL